MNSDNPLLCNPEDGFCEIPSDTGNGNGVPNHTGKEKRIKVVYFTDPICSSCWGIEPQLRRMKLEYGDVLDIEYRMGGLLPSWDGFNGGGIRKPADVATHWDDASRYYEMPIDGDVWIENPLSSSYPPSIAFKAAQLQDEEKALRFLRKLREYVFLKKQNIAQWDVIAAAAKEAGLDVDKLQEDYNGKGKQLFDEDIRITRLSGVRGFPTLIFTNSKGESAILYGSRPYSQFEKMIQQQDASVTKQAYVKSIENLFSKFSSLTAKEYSVLMDVPISQAEKELDIYKDTGKLNKIVTKNGALWQTN